MRIVGNPLATTRGRLTAGIGLVMLAYFLFAFHDAAVKWLVAGLAVWQVLFFRSAIIMLGCLAIGRGALLRQAAATPAKGPLALRGAMILAAWLCYYTAARELQLAELITLYFAAPMLVTLLAVPLLGERITGSRWAAVAIGFAGVVVACNPWGLGLSPPAGLALLAAALWAYALILVRRIALKESAPLLMFYSNGFFLAGTGLAMPFVWRMPEPEELGILLVVATLGGLGQLALFEGMRRAPASVLASFEYTALIWAFVLGFAIWGDVPRGEVFVGAGLILLAGLLMFVNERRLAPPEGIVAGQPAGPAAGIVTVAGPPLRADIGREP